MIPLYVSCGTPHVQAARALTSGLYEKDGLLRPYFKEVIGRRRTATISLLHADCDPPTYHGVCLIDQSKMVQIYVRPEVRGQGYGKRLFDAALAVSGEKKKDLTAGFGDDLVKSSAFWLKMGLSQIANQGEPQWVTG